MKSVMNHSFSKVPHADIQRSSFDRSAGTKLTFDSGNLVPFFIDEALPGDTFNLRTAGFARLATPLFPTMDNMYLDTFYFAVPLRLIWDNFQKMMGQQENPGDSTDYVTPTQTSDGSTGYGEETLQDYLGLPTKITNLTHSALPLRAYNLIWNEWFRDQNLQDSIPVDKDDGPDDITEYVLQKRGKRHDYFTSSLPWPQKGPSIELPLGTSAPIVTSSSAQVTGVQEAMNMTHTDGSAHAGNDLLGMVNGAVGSSTGGSVGSSYYPDNLFADLGDATAATINQLRQAFQIQKMYERDARGGTRYTEIIRSHFGVTSPDARLQRPEFLGGGSTPVNITTVTSTTETYTGSGGRNLGALSGVGVAAFDGHGFTKSFTEHTIIIGLVNIRADLTYQQGLNRMWSREDRLDYYWPSLAHIGEQEVLNKEIYADGSAADEDVFGYQERFAEYRYKPSTIHGRFRSNATQSLDAWHLSQDFSNLPTLSDTFITDNPPIDRILAVTDEPQFIGDFYHKLTTARPMPLYGVPGNIDRF